MSQQSVVMGIPKTQGGLNKDQAPQWVITKFNGEQELSLAKLAERLGDRYQGLHRGNKAMKTEASHSQERVREWGHKSHEGLEEPWDYRQLQGKGGRRGQEGAH